VGCCRDGERGWQTDKAAKIKEAKRKAKTKSEKGRNSICPGQRIIQMRPAFPWWGWMKLEMKLEVKVKVKGKCLRGSLGSESLI
jgi:hypothetical protein